MNDRPQPEAAYDARLASHLLRLLDVAPRDLRFLIEGAQGAYPTDVVASLQELQRTGKAKELGKAIWSSSGSLPQTNGQQLVADECLHEEESEFPEPHPLDFDWRFTRRTLGQLASRLGGSQVRNIAVLGAPTLFKFLSEQGKSVHLFDRNEQIVSYLRRAAYSQVTHCDLFRYSAYKRFDCVVADPPWYLDHYRAFVEAARRMLDPGGKLLLSVLPPLTRPSAEDDRSAIMSFAMERGFEVVSSEPALLGYLSPPFEREALKSEGLTLRAWRFGDLCTFVLSERDVPKYKAEHAEEEQLWHTFTLGPTVVKVKWDGTHFGDAFGFDNVSEMNDIRFRSVSRRSPLRSKINLWTSRNIALNVSRPDLASAALQLLVEGRNSEDVARILKEVEHMSPAEFDRLRNLLAILINEAKS